ncbi:ras GTPase-activating-like protein IQGAP1 [Edwardsiella piscicida]|nr:ras GTPase-activating-like protein IQGAP1 [Edwardsiella piscicida]
MGIIDKSTYTLKCPNCEIVETLAILDKGSNWGGSHWQSGGSFQHFHTEWQGGGLTEPSLKIAKCKVCQQSALATSSY